MSTPILRAQAIALAIVLAQACASPPKKQATYVPPPPAKQQAGKATKAKSAPPVVETYTTTAPTLGSKTSEPGTAEIEHQKQVTITEKTQIPTLKTTSTKADLNRLEPNQLVALGVSRDLADGIIRYRDSHGYFKSVEELQKVEGMSPEAFSSLKQKVDVGKTTG
jgi:DNA uptake protein ComE-like DNA-binding protein